MCPCNAAERLQNRLQERAAHWQNAKQLWSAGLSLSLFLLKNKREKSIIKSPALSLDLRKREQLFTPELHWHDDVPNICRCAQTQQEDFNEGLGSITSYAKGSTIGTKHGYRNSSTSSAVRHRKINISKQPQMQPTPLEKCGGALAENVHLISTDCIRVTLQLCSCCGLRSFLWWHTRVFAGLFPQPQTSMYFNGIFRPTQT